MLTIYKYPVEIMDRQEIEMPIGSDILTVQLQGDIPCLWAIVNNEEEIKEKRIIRIVGTGGGVSELLCRVYRDIPDVGWESCLACF